MKREDAARLLGPVDRLSRIEKEVVLERIESARLGWFRRNRTRLAGATALAAAVCVAVLVLRPSDRAALTARGRAGFSLVVHCADRAPGECQVGDRLAFDFGSAPPAGYVALFARGESGNVIWYLPADESAPSVELATRAREGVLDSVAVIDATFAPGRYEVFAIISAQPLHRAQIRAFARGERLVVPPDVRFETRSFVIRDEETSR